MTPAQFSSIHALVLAQFIMETDIAVVLLVCMFCLLLKRR